MAWLRLIIIIGLVPGLGVIVSHAEGASKAEACTHYTQRDNDAQIAACKVATRVLQTINNGKTMTPGTYVQARCTGQRPTRKLYCYITAKSRGAAVDWVGTCWLVTYARRLPNKLAGVTITRYPRGSW